jgi:hypothetical protein
MFAAIMAAACDDATGPGSTETVSLDFCLAELPAWLAIQNEGSGWQQVLGGADGNFTFEATERVSIAYVRAFNLEYSTQVLNVTRDELQGISGRTCPELFGTKSLTGTVAGLTGQQVVRLSMATRVDATSTGNTSFSFDALPAGPLDLVATRFTTSTTQPADRVIVRRDLDLQSGAQIPVLDFSSSEAQTLSTNTVAFGNRGSDGVLVRTDYLSANGTQHQLMQFTGVSGLGSVFVSIPPGLRGPNDLHLLTTVASGATGTREVSQYYRNPTDRTFTYGPILETPVLSVIATTPYVRPRLVLESQPEYGSAADAFFGQLNAGIFRSLRIFTSAAFLGGRPATWQFEMPELAVGFQTEWGFVTGAEINGNAQGVEANVRLLLGGAPSDGDMVRSAVQTSNNVTP